MVQTCFCPTKDRGGSKHAGQCLSLQPTGPVLSQRSDYLARRCLSHFRQDRSLMEARTVTLMAGVFSVLNTIQFLIFDLRQMTHIGYEADKFSLYLETKSALVSWILNHRSAVASILSLITIAVSCVLLYSIHQNSYKGPLLYTLWIVAYELGSFSLLLLTGGAIRKQFRMLPRLYLILQVSRMALHFACLPCVLQHAYELFKALEMVTEISHRHRSSVSTVDSWPTARLRLLYRRFT
ncbi:transmembrane protein 217 isoform X2 [Heterocephalus glaber]|uniref:Transmembrane protein 217 isoform X2 n=1 Tax=Heterocephalus glaber TaxID=10181 RepID=A0AAX6T137_HETGA|nr:transmembrane protein 217 isoform X2 [Heterocephalus glaber]